MKQASTNVAAPRIFGRKIAELKLSDIKVTCDNHRERIENIDSLAKSIEAEGLHQPPLVHPRGDHFELVFGHRRFEAMKKLKMDKATFFVANRTLEPDEVEYVRANENIQHAALTPIEESIAVAKIYDSLIDKMGEIEEDAIVGTISAHMGFSPTWVRDRLYLCNLCDDVRDKVASGAVPVGHARELAKLADHELQRQGAAMAVRTEDGTGGWNLASLKRWVRDHMNSLKVVPWLMTEPFAGCMACDLCPLNTANDANLFEHDRLDKDDATKIAEGVCTNAGCFAKKQKAVDKASDAAIQRLKKNKVESITKAGVEKYAPSFMKLTTFLRRAKNALTPEKQDPKDGPGSTQKPSKPKVDAEEQQRVDARVAYYAARNHFWTTWRELWAKAWKKMDVNQAAALLLSHMTDVAADLQEASDAGILKVIRSKAFAQCVDLIIAGDVAGMMKIVKKPRSILFDDIDWALEAMILHRMGMKLPAVPAQPDGSDVKVTPFTYEEIGIK